MPRERHVKRRRRRKRRKTQLVKQPGMLGKTFKQKFRYVTRISMDPGTGTAATHVFSCNGLYDPDITGTGHQPIGFDQIMGFYNHYTVIGAKMRATFVSQSTSPISGSSLCAIAVKGDTTPVTDPETILEHGGANYKICTSGNASQKVVLTKSVSLSKFLGQKVLQEDNNAGTASANPLEGVYFHLINSGLLGTEDPLALNVLVQIDYIAVMHEPRWLPGS